jgi:hypothetical protein
MRLLLTLAFACTVAGVRADEAAILLHGRDAKVKGTMLRYEPEAHKQTLGSPSRATAPGSRRACGVGRCWEERLSLRRSF